MIRGCQSEGWHRRTSRRVRYQRNRGRKHGIYVSPRRRDGDQESLAAQPRRAGQARLCRVSGRRAIDSCPAETRSADFSNPPSVPPSTAIKAFRRTGFPNRSTPISGACDDHGVGARQGYGQLRGKTCGDGRNPCRALSAPRVGSPPRRARLTRIVATASSTGRFGG